MCCTDFRLDRLPLDVQRNMLLVRVTDDPDRLRQDTASLLEAAQGQGSLRLVHNCHRYYELAWAGLQEAVDHAQVVHDAGDAAAAVLPGTQCTNARVHVHCGSDAGMMTAHRDKGEHPFLSSCMSVPDACLRSQNLHLGRSKRIGARLVWVEKQSVLVILLVPCFAGRTGRRPALSCASLSQRGAGARPLHP